MFVNDLLEVVHTNGDRFIRSETLFENESILVAKAYYYRNDATCSGVFFDLDLGIKDQDGDVDTFNTLLSKQLTQSIS